MKKKGVVAGIVAGILMLVCMAAEAKNWETDFEKALSAAKALGKYMLLDFSGSDWCGWCIKLKKEVFKKYDFKKFAKDNLVCVLVDFPKRKRQSNKLKQQNSKLAKKYGIRGYPTVIILSPDGKLVGKTGYRKDGVKKYVKYLTKMIYNHKVQEKEKKSE